MPRCVQDASDGPIAAQTGPGRGSPHADHALIHDPRGVAPEFYRDFHATMAKCLNAEQGRWESFWSGHGTSLVRMTTADDVLKFAVYLQVNAVRAGAVPTWSEWPGARSATNACQRAAKLCQRAGRFFHPKKNEQELELKLYAPPVFDDLGGATAWVERLNEEVAREQARIGAELAAEGHRYSTLRKLRSASTAKHSKSYEARRRRNPQIACRDRETRIALLTELVLFRQAYTAARQLWLEGSLDVVESPHGTYQLRSHPRINVMSP